MICPGELLVYVQCPITFITSGALELAYLQPACLALCLISWSLRGAPSQQGLHEESDLLPSASEASLSRDSYLHDGKIWENSDSVLTCILYSAQ